MFGPGLVLVRARLRLLRTEAGGRRGWVASGYRPNWDVGPPDPSGMPGFAMGQIRLLERDRLEPGEIGEIEIRAAPVELWNRVRVGDVIRVCEGPQLVGEATILEVGDD